MRPSGCGTIIRDFRLGHAPESSVSVDPKKVAVHADVFQCYKLALHRAYTQDAVAWESNERVKASKGPHTEEEYAEGVDLHPRMIPCKLAKCRYRSFVMYLARLKTGDGLS